MQNSNGEGHRPHQHSRENVDAVGRDGSSPTATSCRHASNICSSSRELQQDRRFTEGWYYVFPKKVLDLIVEHVGEDRFDPELLRLDRKATEKSERMNSPAGFCFGRPMQYSELGDRPKMSFSDDLIRSAGMEPAKVNFAIDRIDGFRSSVSRAAKAYCGWLLTNPVFLRQHDCLFRSSWSTVAEWGASLAKFSVTTLAVKEVKEECLESEGLANPTRPLFDKLPEFFRRWRLDSLAGPYLPVPAKPLLAGDIPMTVLRGKLPVGHIFVLPDTMPIPSRDELRYAVDEALHGGGAPDHLQEWFEIIRRSNASRNQLGRYARLFDLQHYWRLLHFRHKQALHRRLGKLKEAFAEILKTTPRQISGDLSKIKQRLGDGWEEWRVSLTESVDS